MKKTRTTWTDLPQAVTEWVVAKLGSPVVEWHSQSGGWSPGNADRLICADGKRAFLKAAHRSLNEMTPNIHRQEIAVTQALGPNVPCAHLIDSYDDGDWVALLLEDIEGRHPRSPWQEDELLATLRALDELAEATSGAVPDSVPAAGAGHAADFNRFADLSPEQVRACDPWVQENLQELIRRGAGVGRLIVGESLGHGDLRADNILIQPDGRVRIVDWPHAWRSAPWIDGVLLAPDIENLGGLQGAAGIIDGVPLLTAWAAKYGASSDDVLDVLVGILAYYTHASMQPDVPGLPTLRRDQAQAARAALRVVQRLVSRNSRSGAAQY